MTKHEREQRALLLLIAAICLNILAKSMNDSAIEQTLSVVYLFSSFVFAVMGIKEFLQRE